MTAVGFKFLLICLIFTLFSCTKKSIKENPKVERFENIERAFLKGQVDKKEFVLYQSSNHLCFKLAGDLIYDLGKINNSVFEANSLIQKNGKIDSVDNCKGIYIKNKEYFILERWFFDSSNKVLLLPITNSLARMSVYLIFLNKNFKVEHISFFPNNTNITQMAWDINTKELITSESGYGANPGADYLTFYTIQNLELKPKHFFKSNIVLDETFYQLHKNDKDVFGGVFLRQINRYKN